MKCLFKRFLMYDINLYCKKYYFWFKYRKETKILQLSYSSETWWGREGALLPKGVAFLSKRIQFLPHLFPTCSFWAFSRYAALLISEKRHPYNSTSNIAFPSQICRNSPFFIYFYDQLPIFMMQLVSLW